MNWCKGCSVQKFVIFPCGTFSGKLSGIVSKAHRERKPPDHLQTHLVCSTTWDWRQCLKRVSACGGAIEYYVGSTAANLLLRPREDFVNPNIRKYKLTLKRKEEVYSSSCLSNQPKGRTKKKDQADESQSQDKVLSPHKGIFGTWEPSPHIREQLRE